MNRLVSVLVVLGAALLSGCQKEGCLNGEANCRVPSPCQRVSFPATASCDKPLTVKRIDSASQRPGGWNGLGAKGDVLLSNGVVDVVIADLGTQNYLDPNGGSVLDLSPAGQAKDTVNNIFQVVGVLPRDAAFYTSMELIEEADLVAVQVKGTLDGIPSVPVITRYELRKCEPGLRARTEMVNGSTNTQTWALSDAYYWSGRESLPFAPGKGSGFNHPSFGLTTINGVYRLFPFFAAAGHSSDEHISSFSAVSCTEPALEGFHSDQISAAGLKRQIVPPRGSLVFERFFAVADSKGVGGAVDLALELRKQLMGEAYVTLTGKVQRMGGGTFDAEREASVLVVEGTLTTDPKERVEWSQVVPAADGSFSVRVPAGKSYVVEAHAFGRKQVEREYASVSGDTDLGEFVLPATGAVSFTVKEKGTMANLDAELFLVPTSDAEAEKVVGTLHGRFTKCSPWLGPPPGASPACNRVLVRNGRADNIDVPVGSFDVFAFHGPFWSIAKQTVTITGGPQTIEFALARLPLKPAGALSADLHVHGAHSFDSSIPDYDRVLSFAASDLDVIIGTDHEVIYDYANIVRDLGLQDRLSTVVGLETTGHIPFLMVPGYGFPLVIGHYNMWPLKYDPSLPRNGGPYDERVEPGELFERTRAIFTGEPLIELNHPWADPEFGRDLGFPRAILMDLRKDLPSGDDGTRMGVYVRKPAGASFTNDAHHAQEVMNGSDNGLFLQYRAFWHYMLNQGRVRTGTANSDSHSLTDNTVGVPQNLVFANTAPGANFDIGVFNRALKEGRSLGTNGPVIEVTYADGATNVTPSTTLLKPSGAASIHVRVSSAPWVPVQEVRFLVNGVVKKTVSNLPADADPYADTGSMVDYEATIPLSELTAGVSGDAWLVIEAGRALPLAGDLGGGLDGEPDGMPDTTDNDGNGVVDTADVKAGSKIGPLADPPKPKRGEPGYEFAAITGGYPAAFTNPFLLDLNGDGAFNAPGVKGGAQ